MRLARIWLLVLLAVLLPVRGAMAGALVCPPAQASHGHAATLHDGEAAPHAHELAGGEQHAGHPTANDDSAHDHHHDGAGHDKCSLCAACCSGVPLASAFPTVPEAQPAAQSFPALLSPAPTFVSGGQERPPRSL